ncbi:MAG: HsdR family type I site-specific deoxyribonuclease [Thermotogae bacterium]|nr:HsdR family type I site-specific deoxyribonuclease [Thermotogota bacterium]
MSLSSERLVVQEPMIRYAQEVGWIYLSPDEALRLRGGEGSPVLKEVLIRQLQKLNPTTIASRVKAEEVVDRLIRVRPNIEGNYEAWQYLKGLKTVFVEAERREKNVKLLDLENPNNNVFHITEEFRFVSGHAVIRPDIVFFINGIPVIIVETKAATREEGIAEAFEQICRYHREGAELMVQSQIFTLTNLVRFFYGPTWNLSRKALFNWKDEQAGDFETLVKTFISSKRILEILANYILFVRRDGELSKVILRPHQMRAVRKVIGRARDPQRRRGLVWHTQGSGKTYTMITAAKLILEDPRFENPTVLMIVDRNELQQQLFQNLESAGFKNFHIAQSKKHLRKLLKEDTRGLIVSMIHKFDKADANLNTRPNIVVLIDEAHRSTGGDLGNYLMGALPNATFIGFTGTPIDKTHRGKGTFKIFGIDDPPKGYIDKYSIRESIEDGTTVPLHYQMAPNDLLVDRQAMEKEFWEAVELEGVSDVEEINRVLDRAVTLKNMLKNPERVDKVAKFVAEHFRNFVEPMGYKAFLVGVDREACVLYKEALDRYLPPEYSQVVISRGYNDPPHLKRYHLSDDQEALVRKSFRKPDENPKILIVTEKLLTGYDAPILYVMYLDKPMRDHVLLQAIARVNRPYEDESGRKKTSGLIVDFVGIFDNLERALAFDSEDIKGVIEDLEVLKERFQHLIKMVKSKYLILYSYHSPEKVAEAILEHFRDKDAREEFYSFFREIQEIYEILSPDPFLRPFLEDYKKLVEMYRLLRSSYEPHVPVDKSFLRKTAEIVQKHTHTKEVRQLREVYEITAQTLDSLLSQKKPDTVKMFNLINEIARMVEENGKQQPYLIPIGERAENIRQAFIQRQISSREALKELSRLVAYINRAQKSRSSKSNLSDRTFAIYTYLLLHKNMNSKSAENLALKIDEVIGNFPHWKPSNAHERELRRKLYKVLADSGIEFAQVVPWSNALIDLLWRLEDGV